MSTMVEYDLDTSGGLMDQIQALIAPPQSDDKDKSKKSPEHPYFKRPGKGHNHDSCDACGEGGDLICCDKCPSSFHLQCHDPPLEKTDIPMGDWLCHSCIYSKQQIVAPAPLTRSKRASSTPATSISNRLVKKAKSSPMEMLIEAANSMNPKQFELPRSMSVPCIFPGTDKVESLAQTKRTLRAQKEYEKAANGLVPLPAKKCHECRKSCHVAPLIACDYCPLYFHLDCLDPPLTAPPTVRWMCPLHVEHALDSKLLTSVSATERVRLWDRFTGPLDQDAIKLEFFRKIHRKNPPFRFKVKLGPKNCVVVPSMIKEHYRRPVHLLPSLKELYRLRSVEEYRKIKERSIDEVTIKEMTDEENADDNLKDCTDTDSDNKDESILKCDIPENNIDCDFEADKPVKTEIVNGVLYNSEFVKKEIVGIDCIHDITRDVELELRHLDDRLLRILAYQQVQHILTQPNNKANNLVQLFSENLQNKLHNMPLPSELLTPADIDRISRVFSSPKKKTKPRSNLRARAMLCPIVSKHFYNVRTSEVDPTDVRHDASYMGFRPTVSARFPEAVAMRYRVLNIGKGSANDVDLERFGHCNYISPKHAVVFYDEHTKHYELINYSPYGTYVNNVFFSNDIPERTKSSNGNIQESKTANVEVQVRDIIDKKRKICRNKKGPFDFKMTALDSIDRMECCCNVEEIKSGWEVSAILNHGALLKFGCVPFVFSIVEGVS